MESWYRYQSKIKSSERQISRDLPRRAPWFAPGGGVDGRGQFATFGAIDIGGSHVGAASVLTKDGILTVERRAFESIDPHASASAIIACIVSAASSVGESRCWAVAVPGPFDYQRGVGSFHGVGKFDSLSGVNLRGQLARGLGVAPGALHFVNDASAYGIGEWAFGAARGHDRVICLTLGTGIGSVFLVDGIAVNQGTGVPPEGHLYLQRFDGRPLEDFVSSRALEASYLALTARRSTVKQICAAAKAGDAQALEVIAAAMSVLGSSVGPWAENFGASVIVIGGSISQAWDVLEGPFRRGLRSHSESIAQGLLLAQAELLEEGPLLGAAAWLRGRL